MKIFRFVVLLLFFIISLFVNVYLVYKVDAKHQLHDFYWYSYLILYLSFSFVILFITDIFYKLNVFLFFVLWVLYRWSIIIHCFIIDRYNIQGCRCL